MPLTSIIILSSIVGAFAAFGLVLAWGEHRTRHLNNKPRSPGEESPQPTVPASMSVDARAERSREFEAA